MISLPLQQSTRDFSSDQRKQSVMRFAQQLTASLAKHSTSQGSFNNLGGGLMLLRPLWSSKFRKIAL